MIAFIAKELAEEATRTRWDTGRAIIDIAGRQAEG